MPGKILQVPFVKISVEDRAQDLLDRFSISVQNLYSSSVGKISVRDLLARSLYRSR